MIIETDLGRDPDDFFTICYLAAVGMKIDAIVVTPGDRDQLAVAKFLSKELNLNVPIGCHKKKDGKAAIRHSRFHSEVLKRRGHPIEEDADGFGKDFINDSDWIVIGPPSNVGRYLDSGGRHPKKIMMQGGFLPYKLHNYDVVRLPDFEGKEWMPTFNMNGDRPGTMTIVNSTAEKRFCGKNVCHTILLTADRVKNFKPKNTASELFVDAAKILFEKYEAKKFHDPVAACCMIHPEIGTWIQGKPAKKESGWTTELTTENSYVLADIDRDKFWESMYEFR